MAINSMMRENRPTALITGSSRGIGFELAKQFAQYGHDLILVSRIQAELQHAAEKLQRDTACKVTVVSLDLTDDDVPQSLLSQLEVQAIQVDVLVNNAGLDDSGLFIDSQLGRQMKLLRLKILSLTALTHLFLKGMIERGHGRILNVSSLVANFSGGPSWSSYVASMQYVLAFCHEVRHEIDRLLLNSLSARL